MQTDRGPAQEVAGRASKSGPSGVASAPTDGTEGRRRLNQAQRVNLRVIVRGTLQVTLAMMATASCMGWLLLGFLARNKAGPWTLLVTLGALTLVYGLLGAALGGVMGRRLRTRGLVAVTLGTMLAWGILELFFYMADVGSAELRTPLIVGIPLSVFGALLGMSRPADREARLRELREAIEELETDDDRETGGPPPG